MEKSRKQKPQMGEVEQIRMWVLNGKGAKQPRTDADFEQKGTKNFYRGFHG